LISTGFFRGLCSGLGLLDIWIGFWKPSTITITNSFWVAQRFGAAVNATIDCGFSRRGSPGQERELQHGR